MDCSGVPSLEFDTHYAHLTIGAASVDVVSRLRRFSVGPFTVSAIELDVPPIH